MATSALDSFLAEAHDSSPEDGRILDAALDLFGDIGIQRSTIGDVARRAGVNRVTVYRRIGSKDDLIAAVVTREATRLFAEVAAAARRGKTFDDRLAAAFATTIDSVRRNQIFNRLLSLESETVLPQLTTQAGPLLAAAIGATMRIFEEAVEDGLQERADDKLPSAEVLVRVVHSFLLTPSALVSLDTYDELVEFARTHLGPIVSRVVND